MSTNRPSNCRNALQAAGKPYPKSGCAVCETGGITGCPYERAESSNAGDTHMKLTADDLAADIRRINGNHAMGAGGLADALFAAGWGHIAGQQGVIAEYIAARDDLEAAESPPNSHARPRVVSQGDSRLLRWREARAALAARSPQPANPAGLMLIDTAVAAHIASQMYGPRYGIDWVYYCDKRGRLSEHEAFAQPPKPAGAVPLPELAIVDSQCECHPETCGHWPYDLKLGELKIRNGDLNACSETKNAIIAYGNDREAAAGGVPAITEAMIEMAARKVSAIAGENWGALGDFTRGVLMDTQRQAFAAAIPPQPTAEPAADGLSLKSRPDFISGYDAGVADEKLTQACNPAVEATGTVDGYSWSGQTVDIILDGSVPRWMIGDKIRVTISPTGGKSDA